jgi:ABC-2 type transport system permease protein
MKLSRLSIYLKQSNMMLQDILVYRADFSSRFLASLIRFGITIYLWVAILNGQGGILGDYSIEKIMTYFLIMQIVSSFVFSSAQSGFRIASDIQSGDLSSRLAQPVDTIFQFMAMDSGRSMFFFLSNAVIFLGIAALFPQYFEFHFNWSTALLSAIATLSAFVLNFCFATGIGMLSFWMGSSTRLIYNFFAVVQLLSGMIMPLDLFPVSIQTVLNWTPFPYIYYFPVHLLQAEQLTPELIQGFFISLAYTVVLFILLRILYHQGLKTYEAVGR